MADDEGWIEWAGGDCPVALDLPVQVKFLGHPEGPTSTKKACYFLSGLWEHDPDIRPHWHIIAYRLVKS